MLRISWGCTGHYDISNTVLSGSIHRLNSLWKPGSGFLAQCILAFGRRALLFNLLVQLNGFSEVGTLAYFDFWLSCLVAECTAVGLW